MTRARPWSSLLSPLGFQRLVLFLISRAAGLALFTNPASVKHRDMPLSGPLVVDDSLVNSGSYSNEHSLSIDRFSSRSDSSLLNGASPLLIIRARAEHSSLQ